MSQVIEEKYDQVRSLITLGKERGYLLYDEVNEALPAEVHSPEELDGFLATLERYGIEIFEDSTAAKTARAETTAVEQRLSIAAARTVDAAQQDRPRYGEQRNFADQRDGT